MKVLHIATHDNFGGAARAAYRQHLALSRAGMDSRMLVRHKHTDDPQVQVFAGQRDLSLRADRTIRRTWISYLEAKSRVAGKTGLTDPRADLLRQAVSEMADADVINLHKTEHFADIPALLASIPAAKPVVVTLHDLSPVTGGCDYPGNCDHFKQACGRCPVLNSRQDRDYSKKIFRWRQAAYGTRRKNNFALVANSRWTLEQARLSGLTGGIRIELIHYGLDQSIYHPADRVTARQALGIGADDAVVSFAAHNLSYPHKGGTQLAGALDGIRFDGALHLLTMGAGQFKAPARFKHIHFGRIESDQLQSLIYRSADVFVIPSLEEAFGQTALEAIACGAVVAGFAVGGITDIVQNNLNGQLVTRAESAGLGQAITSLLKNETMKSRWRDLCAGWVKECFSFERNATAYHELYKSLLAAQ